MLEEIELLVAGRRPEVVADDDQALFAFLAFLVDHRDARLLAERRIGQHHVVSSRRLLVQAVGHRDRALVAADAVQVEVHRASRAVASTISVPLSASNFSRFFSSLSRL